MQITHAFRRQISINTLYAQGTSLLRCLLLISAAVLTAAACAIADVLFVYVVCSVAVGWLCSSPAPNSPNVLVTYDPCL